MIRNQIDFSIYALRYVFLCLISILNSFLNYDLFAQNPGDLIWSFTTGDIVYSSPGVSNDGTIYIGSEDTKLYAINPNGSQKWQSAIATDWVDSSPAIANDGTIYYGSWDNKLYAISPETGTKNWDFPTSGYIISSPAIAQSGTIYFGSSDGNFYALNAEGTLKWNFATAESIESSPAIAKNGTIYFCGFDGVLYALDASGTKLWMFQTDDIANRDNRIAASPAIDAEGNIYIGSGNYRLYKIDAAGNLIWSFEAGDEIDSSPVCGQNGQIYVASRDGFLYALDDEGTPLWFQNIGDVFYSSPVVDANDNVYIASFTGNNTSTLFAFDADGNLLWLNEFNTTGAVNLIDSSPTIAPNGMLYIGSYDGKLYSFDTGSTLATSVWPKFSHDLKNTSQRVNLLPTVSINNFSVDEGQTLIISNSNLAASDLDDENSTLRFTIETLPANGTLKKSEIILAIGESFLQSDINNNTTTYQHNGSETATDSFKFTISDGSDTTPPFTFLINVNPKNDFPIAAAINALTVDEGNSALISSAQLAATDSDDEDLTLRFTIETLPANGALKKSEIILALGETFLQSDINNNTITYQHNGSETAADSFKFTLSDGSDTTPSFTFLINVNPKNDFPIAMDDSFTTNEKTSVIGNLFADNGSNMDNDADGDALFILSINGLESDVNNEITLPSGALLTVNENGIMNYNPNPAINALGFIDRTAQDGFTYTITDKNGGTSLAAVLITISGVTDTLNDLLQDLLAFIPDENSNNYIKPGSSDQNEWKDIINQMLNGDCDAITLPENWSNSYSISTYTDSENSDDYCILMEILDAELNNKADKGWGTFIINKNPLRNLSIQTPYPAENPKIATQGIQIFKDSNSRSYLMAGAHANTSTTLSTCQTGYSESDAGHDIDTMFYQTQSVLNDFHQSDSNFSVLQFHRLSDILCSGTDVYLTYGTNQTPGSEDIIITLKSNLESDNPNWQINIPGDSPVCSEHGDTNIQGRLLNGISDVCNQNVASHTERFIYITQKTGHEGANNWIDSINATWPSINAIHTFDLTLSKGWNLISIPVDTDELVTDLFKSVIVGKVWRYSEDNYVPTLSFEPKIGYWLYSDDDTSIPISGAEITNFNTNLKSGWQLIGPSAQPTFTHISIEFNEILVSANGLQSAVWYFDDHLFKIAKTFNLGKGYWVLGY